MADSASYAAVGKRLLKVAVAFLVALSIAASAALLTNEGLTPAVVGNVVVTVYISGLVVYGIVRDAMDTRRFRLALYVGVVLWGAERLLSGGESPVSYALLLGGAALFVRELYFVD